MLIFVINQFFHVISEDVEFYHGKEGITLGLENVAANVKKNLCRNNNFRLRREAVAGSVKVFPLQNTNAIYGAIISGDIYFI